MKSKSCGHSSCEENGGLCFSPGSLLVWGMLFVCICVFHIADLGPLGYWRLADKAQPRWRRIITWFLQYCSIQNYRHKVFVFAILFVFCDLWLLVNNCRFAVPSTIVCAPFFETLVKLANESVANWRLTFVSDRSHRWKFLSLTKVCAHGL